MNFAVILAGGLGRRMKSANIPKQFLELNGIPIIKITVDKFVFSQYFDSIVIAAPDVWLSHTKDIFKDEIYSKIRLCNGGRSRQESLYNAARFIKNNYKLDGDDIIVSHDAVRPFVSFRIIKDNIDALNLYDAVDTVIATNDTIVKSIDGKIVDNIPNRAEIYRGQTPQSFKIDDWIDIYSKQNDDYLRNVTDAIRIFSDNGKKVGMVYGEESNIKITNEFDLAIATFLLGKI